eukprot:TRINITY_DN7062_c0_g1_i1.p1 TRINITY_DN7062_c0_g1~~TRINITY_DN7062_c0_g1_i1.p1  ORF type:complete len:195 (-),score=38.36 TRINITY_DN7062_c0_g1_i1:384-968(-)
MPLEERARLGIGFLPQEASIFRNLSVHDNLLLVMEETGVPANERKERIHALLAQFGLLSVAGTRGGALSGGERRRAELARALAVNCNGRPPQILLCDEPFAGVDPLGVQEIQSLLRGLATGEANMGIFISDHNVRETLHICDRAYMMHQGRLLAEGTPQQICDDQAVRRYYLGDYFLPKETLVRDEATSSLSAP